MRKIKFLKKVLEDAVDDYMNDDDNFMIVVDGLLDNPVQGRDHLEAFDEQFCVSAGTDKKPVVYVVMIQEVKLYGAEADAIAKSIL
jgi:hypothetical protein